MKKIKRTLVYTTLATATLAAPLVLAVSCNNNKSSNIDYYFDDTSSNINQTTFEFGNEFELSPTLITSAKNFLTSTSYDLLKSGIVTADFADRYKTAKQSTINTDYDDTIAEIDEKLLNKEIDAATANSQKDDALEAKEAALADLDSDYNAFKSDFNAQYTPSELIQIITPENLQEFSVKSKITNSNQITANLKTKIMGQVQGYLLDMFYVYNNDDSFNAEVARFINDQSLQINSIGGGRGSWITDRSKGGAPAYVNPNFHRAINDDALVVLQDSRVEPGFSQHTLTDHNTVSSSALQTRYSDKSSVNGNTTNTLEGIATTQSLIRTKVSGEDRWTGSGWDTSTKREFNSVLEGVSLFVSDDIPAINAPNPTVATNGTLDISNGSTLKTSLDDHSKNTLTFRLDSSKPVKYVKGNGQESNYVLKGRDYFLGFMHQLYTDQETRENGKSENLPKLSADELKSIKEEYGEVGYEEYVNYNMYLYDLYNVDIEGTIKANEQLYTSNDPRWETDFVVKFNDTITTTGLQFFTDSNICSPVSSQKVAEDLANSPVASKPKNEIPGHYYGITTYFPIKQNGSSFTDVESWLTVSPYYFSEYNITPATGKMVIKKNTHYMDSSFATDPNTIDTYQMLISPTTVDQGSWATQRKNAFLNDEELILDTQAASVKEITDSIGREKPTYKTYSKPITKGYVGNITWNPFGYDAPGYNDLGKKLMFGVSDDASTNFNAIEGFFNGNGAKTRAIINSSINWFSVAQGYFPDQGKTWWQSVFAPELEAFGTTVDGKTPTVNTSTNDFYKKSSFTDNTSDLVDIYNKNLGNKYDAMMTSKTLGAAKELDKLASDIGATPENPATIPFQFYEFFDTPTAQVIEEMDKLILVQLNKLTPRVKFVRTEPQSWNDYMTTSRRAKNGATLMHSFGKDYDGIGSIAQQYMTSYCTNSELDFVYQILKG